MKHPFIISLLISLTSFSFGQQLPYVGPGQTFVFPNETNHFINSASINWALDTEETYSFAGPTKVDNENIFNLVITKAILGKLDAYSLRLTGFEGFENSTYSTYDKFPNKDLTKDEINFVMADSSKTIKFHEIFYLDNYSLNCQIISAAPMTNYATGGVSLGLQEIFYCCKSIKTTVKIDKNNDIIHLKKIEKVLNIDSLQNSKIIKQTYGFNLIQSIWLGASHGSVKLLDTKTNQIIPAKNILNYSYLDSVQIPIYDIHGSVIGHTMRAGQAAFPNKLANSIQFVHDFYYDRRQNIFFSTVSDCYLFVKNFDETTYEMKLEKRFRIL
ncbi:MAG: hypothetical protein ABJB11_04230 [Ferruginibacter sp.]